MEYRKVIAKLIADTGHGLGRSGGEHAQTGVTASRPWVDVISISRYRRDLSASLGQLAIIAHLGGLTPAERQWNAGAFRFRRGSERV